ncbi:hypothetical protein HDU67_001771 [Dinochytrium kinnereticum]|nr:hypothetical protein HDU67_001771 [Dinochytrium kinnereticum]
MAKLSTKMPRIKPPKLLNYHLLIRSPFPQTRPGSAEKHAISMSDIKRRTDFYYAAINASRPLKPLADLETDLAWTDEGNDAQDDVFATADLEEEGSKRTESVKEEAAVVEALLAEMNVEDSSPVPSPTSSPSSHLIPDVIPPTSTSVAIPTRTLVDDIPLPRSIMRHVISPSPLLATHSPVGKVTGFRIEVNGRRGTRAMRQVMHYGKLATKDSYNSHVDYGRASYYNKKGSTGVRIWVGYGR